MKNAFYKVKTLEMKKILFSLALLAASGQFVKAQNVTEGTIAFMNADQPVFIGNYNYPKSLVEKVLTDRLAASGLDHAKNKKGFNGFIDATWTGVMDAEGDIYTKVSGSKNNAIVYVLLSKGYDNFISSASDPRTAAKTKDFLTGLEKDIHNYQIQLTIAEKQQELDKQQEKENKLRRELEQQIAETQKAQAALEKIKSNQ